MPRWSMDPSGAVLGFFSFQKLLMYHDLDTDRWPSEAGPQENAVVASLFRDRFPDPGPAIGPGGRLDDHLGPSDMHHVVDADSSQAIVIADVAKGRNLVVQGPPGTGKSQTIVNIIADAISQGKTVLFVSEKMAALEVVKRRLDSLGLGDACLDLHSRKTTKRAVLDELQRTIELGKPHTQGIQEALESLTRNRDRLNSYDLAVNTPVGSTETTPHTAMGELSRLAAEDEAGPLPSVDVHGIESWSKAQFERKRETVSELQVMLGRVGIPEQHIFWGTELGVLPPHEQRGLQQTLETSISSLRHLTSCFDSLGKALHLSLPTQPSDAEAVLRYLELRTTYDHLLRPEAWGAELRSARQALVEKGRSFFRFLSGEFRQAKRQVSAVWRTELPQDVDRWLEVVDAVIEAQRLIGDSDIPAEVKHSLEEVAGNVAFDVLCERVPETLSAVEGHHSNIGDLQATLKLDTVSRLEEPEGLWSLPFPEQMQILTLWSERLHEIHDIITLNNGYSAAADEGLDAIVELSKRWSDAPNSLTAVLDMSWYESIVSRAYSERRDLATFDSGVHEAGITQYAEKDRQALVHNRSRVAAVHWDGLPSYGAAGEVAVLRREFEKKSRHLPIRRLVARAGRAIQATKSVFMMSPLSIANYLPSGEMEFDIVVFDEASQVRPADALGALMRAKQAVVVGDSEQLPPTSFFDNLISSDEDEDDEDGSVTTHIESILGLFRSQGAPIQSLQWHYRSRHESLIALSNQEFYDNRLLVFASPDFSRAETGLRFHYLPDSVYDRGRSRTNRIEARAVAKAVMEHGRNSPELTLGVAAFSLSQTEAIRNELEMLRREDSSNEDFFAAHPHEPFFVKNLETVQGDERDVIFISVGYGKDANGRVELNFGPLSRDGGHRRLKVLVTRAKRRCHVFTNLRGDDIALDRTRYRGVSALKTFLDYAESGVLRTDTPVESGRDFGSPFQGVVAELLRSRGYEVHEEVSSGGYFVDMAVVDLDRPGRYVLGIEFDGASYHSARWARDRDRLREQVLTDLGWRLHRIWSTDWFTNPGRGLDRAVEAIEQAIASKHTVAVPKNGLPMPAIQRDESQSEPDELVMPPYTLAAPKVTTGGLQLHEVSPFGLIGPIAEVVRVESPVHVDEVARRITNAAGLKRTGARIRDTIDRAIRLSTQRNKVVRAGDFLWDPNIGQPNVRSRSESPPQLKRIEYIAPEEVYEAIRTAVKHSFGISRDDAATYAGTLLGFGRLSQRMRESISSHVSELIDRGDLTEEGANLRLQSERSPASRGPRPSGKRRETKKARRSSRGTSRRGRN